MHKDAPYVMALAMSESSRLKKLRAAQQGQGGQMPQPKVVDQAIQSINPPPQPPAPPPQPQQGMAQQPPASQQLPEQQGVAQLPAPNMQSMADGGIVGYDDGGVVKFARGDIVIGKDGKKYYEGENGKLLEPGGAAAALDVAKRGASGISSLLGKVSDYSNRNANNPAAMNPTAPAPKPPAPSAPPPPPPAAPPVPVGPSMNPGNQLPAPPAPKESPAGPAAGPAANPAAGPAMPDASAASSASNEAKIQEYLSDARGALTGALPADAEAGQDLAYFAAQRKAAMPQGEAYDKYQASLEKEAADEPAEKEKAGLMALTKGFLMVAAGESPNALSNIAKGLGVGLEDYAGALKDFRKAGKERQKQLGDIEQARRAEKRGDVDAAFGYMEKAKDRESRRQQVVASGIAQLNSSGLSSIAGLMSTQMQGQNQLAVTGLQGQNQLAVASLQGQNQLAVARAQEAGAEKRLNAPSAQEKNIRAAMADPAYKAMALEFATAAPVERGEQSMTKYWNSVEGQMALRMLASSKDPNEQARAKTIKDQLRASSLSFTDQPTGPVRK
jgi:hypothetical protein